LYQSKFAWKLARLNFQEFSNPKYYLQNSLLKREIWLEKILACRCKDGKIKHAPGKFKLNFGRKICDSSPILPFGERTHLFKSKSGTFLGN
jgi:hypothetical protein